MLLLSLAIGGIVGIAYVNGPRALRFLIRVYTWIARGVPLLIVLFLVFYGPSVMGMKIDRFVAAVISLTFFGAANVAESVKAAIISVRKSYVEAAEAIGMSPFSRLIRIVLPLMMPFLLPALIGDFMNLVKDSTLVSPISVTDLMFRGQMLIAQTFDALLIYLLICFFYYVTCLCLEIGGRRLEARLSVLR